MLVFVASTLTWLRARHRLVRSRGTVLDLVSCSSSSHLSLFCQHVSRVVSCAHLSVRARCLYHGRASVFVGAADWFYLSLCRIRTAVFELGYDFNFDPDFVLCAVADSSFVFLVIMSSTLAWFTLAAVTVVVWAFSTRCILCAITVANFASLLPTTLPRDLLFSPPSTLSWASLFLWIRTWESQQLPPGIFGKAL